MSRKLILVLVMGLLAFSMVACSGNNGEVSRSPEDVVAIVNSKEILWGDFQRVLENTKLTYQQYGIDFDDKENVEMLELVQEEALLNLIQETLLLQQAVEQGHEFTEAEIEYELERLKAQFEDEDEFMSALEMNDLTLEELKVMIANDNLISRYIHGEIGEIIVTEEELMEIYEEYKQVMEDMPELDEVRIQLEEEIKYEKFMVSLEQLLERLTDESDIEILL